MGGQEKRQSESGVSFGSYRLDVRNAQLRRGAQEVKLTGKAFAVLRYFVEHPGQLATKDDLFAAAWPETVVSDAALTSCIQELRHALRDDAKKPRYIETVHKRGYRFLPPVTTQSVGSERQAVSSSQEEAASNQQSTVNSQLEENRQAKGGQIETEREKSEQAEGVRLQPEESPPGSPSIRFWSSKVSILAALVLLTATVFTVYYWPRPPLSTQDSGLRTDAAPAALPLPDKPSIAVMPFANMSGDPAQEYFSDGLTDDLITDLSRLSQLFVIARNSTFTYKGKAVKVQEVSKELGVQYVLEGSIQKTAERVRINAQLVDATTGHHLWAERYERPLTDIFALQDEIVQKIVTTLKLQLTLWEHGIRVRKRTDSVEAYDFYLRGLASFFRFTKEAHLQARQLFEQAVTLDPQYAEAYASLGGMYQMAGFFQWSQDPRRDLEQAFTLAQQAVALDDSLPLAHHVLSIIYLQKRQYEQARVEAERVIALAPNSPLGYRTLGAILNFTGQAEQAIGMLEQALRFDPRYPLPYQAPLSWAYLGTRRYDDAITLQQKALRHNPHLLESHLILTISYSELGREEEARAEAAEVLRLSPTFSLDVVKQTWPFKDPAAMGRTLTALRKAGLK